MIWAEKLAEKLGIGATFPNLTLNLVGGGTLDLPSGLDAKYRIILFYRGHWWPYCRRQLDGFEENWAAIDGIGGKIVAASVDDIENASKIADGKGFSFGYGVTRDIADKLGSWWEDRRGLIQPSEFLVNAENKVVVSSYSDGPLGRFEAPDIVKLINFYESQKK